MTAADLTAPGSPHREPGAGRDLTGPRTHRLTDSVLTDAGADVLAVLLRRCGRGDEIAFAEPYALTAPRVYGMALQLMRGHANSEEVTQGVFLGIRRTAARFDATKGSTLPWLLTIAHRRSVEQTRSAGPDATRTTLGVAQ